MQEQAAFEATLFPSASNSSDPAAEPTNNKEVTSSDLEEIDTGSSGSSDHDNKGRTLLYVVIGAVVAAVLTALALILALVKRRNRRRRRAASKSPATYVGKPPSSHAVRIPFSFLFPPFFEMFVQDSVYMPRHRSVLFQVVCTA